MELTQDTLKNIATSCVSEYVTSDVPLTDSIIKVASDNELNPDQIQRVVETTNQLAYLSKLASSEDRTSEFKLAEYVDVMSGLFNDIPTFNKQASIESTISSIFSVPMEKAASDSSVTLSKSETMSALYKVASQSRKKLDSLVLDKQDLMVKIAQRVEILKRDPLALDKIASTSNPLELTKLAYGHTNVYSTKVMFSDRDMEDVKLLSDTLDMAKSASEEYATLYPKVIQAERFIKEASIGSLIGSAKSLVGKMPKPVRNVASTVNTKLKKPIAAASAAIGTLEMADNINTTSKKTKRTSDVWSSLRG
tara:strand:+ start:933 stop:1856 length:924 start_codon:yes stop_codon:yes gene_type:complete